MALGQSAAARLALALAPWINAQLPIPASFTIYAKPLFEAAVYGFLTALIFTLWPLARVEDIRAATLFRDQISRHKTLPALRYLLAIGGLLTALLASAVWFNDTIKLTLWMAAGIIGALFAGLIPVYFTSWQTPEVMVAMLLLGILGGLRTVVADLTWIRSYVLWERRDRAGCEALMRAACALDPHSRYFWENTGYAVGFDLAHWEIRKRGGYAKVPAETQERLFKAYARRGIEILEEGRGHAKITTPLVLCAAQLAEIKLKDHRLAASYYQTAAEAPDAPWYAARICAQTLWEDGRREEAYGWLRQYWTTRMLPKEDGFPDDLQRLRMMEEVLRVRSELRIPRQAWER